MDQSIVNAKTYVLKTNIHCTGCEKKLKKLLQNISGVHRISIDAEHGKITVSGTIDPHTLSKLVGKKSDFLLEPVLDPKKDLQIVPKQKSVSNYHGLNDKDVVAQLQKLSEFRGLKSVELTREKMKLTFRDGDDSCENGACSAKNSAMHKRCCGHHETNNDYDFNVKHASWCAGNPSTGFMHTQHCICNDCKLPLPPTCRCMASQGSTPVSGIPWPGYINTPSAPPEYYLPPPVPPPYNDHLYTTFSDDNPRSCMVM